MVQLNFKSGGATLLMRRWWHFEGRQDGFLVRVEACAGCSIVRLRLLVKIWRVRAFNGVAYGGGCIVLIVELELVVKLELLLMQAVELLHAGQRLHEKSRGLRLGFFLVCN